jgi:DNA-binding NtrC family response regulator
MSAPKKQCVFLIDDEDTYRSVLVMLLEDQGYSTIEAASLAEARAVLSGARPFDTVLLDAALPDGSGLSLVPEVQEAQPTARIVLLSGAGDVQTAEPGADVVARVLKGGEPEDLLALLRSLAAA